MLFAVVASVLAWPHGGVEAHTYRVRNNITASWSADAEDFYGRVTSGRASCFRRRLVKVYTEGGHAAATDYTNRRGRWRAHVANPPSQTYHAIIFPTPVRKNAEHDHRCRGDSAPVDV